MLKNKERVLLVDDEKDFIEALSARLSARGLEVDVAESGDGALRKVSEKNFDVIILDLSMPGMDGVETLRVIKNDHPDLQVILLTGHATVEKSVEAMKLGAMDFLEKPVDIKVLFEKIKEAKKTGEQKTEVNTQKTIQDILKTKGW